MAAYRRVPVRVPGVCLGWTRSRRRAACDDAQVVGQRAACELGDCGDEHVNDLFWWSVP
ncbi:MAG: hypothetical protein ACRDTA_07530 [Pseudonocardiaceae bacterium]